MIRLKAGILIAIASSCLATGCATIIHGTTQKVGIASTPPGAKVSIDNQPYGLTPVFADLKRKESHTVVFELDGYEKTSLTITNSVSGWIWGNLAFGGLIGLAVDGISGGIYKLEPEQLAADMRLLPANAARSDGGLYVVAVMVPDPTWQKIGQLEVAKPPLAVQ